MYQISILRSIAPAYLIKMEFTYSCAQWFDELFVFSIVVGLSWIVENLAWDEAYATIRARSSATEHKALASILSATCDSVVHLDSDMRVVGPNPNLEAMIHFSKKEEAMASSHSSKSKNRIDGVHFSSLVWSSEARSLEENLAQTREQYSDGACARLLINSYS